MKSETVSYEELARRVGNMVLFNNHSNYEVDQDWVYGLVEQPLMRERLDALDREASEDEATNFGEFEAGHSVTDFDIYQSYAITPGGAEYLFNHTAELISYSEKLGLWFWHIGHWGTAWSGVHTTVYEVEDYDKYVSEQQMLNYRIG